MNAPRVSLTGLLMLFAVVIAGLCFAQWGMARGSAAAVGGTLGVLNWVSLRWLVGRMMGGSEAHRAGFSLLLVAKMGLLIGIVIVLMNRFSVEPIGLILGLSVLFLGPVLGGLLVGPTGDSEPSIAGTAGEEH